MENLKELDKERVKQVSANGRVANILQFMLLDMYETVSMVAEREFHKAGLGEKPKVKTLKNIIKYGVKDLRAYTRQMPEADQEWFGEDSDQLLKILLTAIDRTGDNGNAISLFQNYIDAFESKYKLNIRQFGV